MSKFDYDVLYDEDDTYLAVSKERYTLDEARAIAEHELGAKARLLANDYCVRHRTGRSLEGEPTVGWFLDFGILPQRPALRVGTGPRLVRHGRLVHRF